MPQPIIQIKNLSKKYKLRQKSPYYSLRDSIVSLLKKPLLRPNPEASFYALNNLTLDISPGEVLGVIGGNGAGKSTLLKIISRITPPTTGSVALRGRVASLLEVGTGFHPELTGNENIFLNGTILGMSRKEIKNKFKKIVEFSEIGKFLDTPIKHYSSGMYTRLAFSVAAFLDSEILLIDEVLAVGDAKFQKKSIGKMHDIAKSGRTVIFVSHNMSAIQSLCPRSLLLSKGKLVKAGESRRVIAEYLKMSGETSKISLKDRKDRQGSGKLRMTRVFFKDALGKRVNFFRSGEDACLWIEFNLIDPAVKRIDFAISIDDFLSQNRIAFISNKIFNQHISTSQGVIKIKISHLPLTPGKYQFTVIVIDQSGDILDWVQKAGTFSVEFGDYYKTGQLPLQPEGSLLLDYQVN